MADRRTACAALAPVLSVLMATSPIALDSAFAHPAKQCTISQLRRAVDPTAENGGPGEREGGMTETAPSAKTIAKYGKWLAVYGGGLILLGALAIILPGVAALATAILLGWLFIAGGVIGIVSLFTAGVSAPGYIWKLLAAIIGLLAGGALLWHPVAGAVTLTIILAAYLFSLGVTKVMMALRYRQILPNAWGLMMFTAIVDIALGIVIVAGLTRGTVWLLGLLIGIEFVFTGLALVVAGVNCREATAPAATATRA
jgi:uncharacterized membrane protein HdeD (DUF308 family)